MGSKYEFASHVTYMGEACIEVENSKPSYQDDFVTESNSVHSDRRVPREPKAVS